MRSTSAKYRKPTALEAAIKQRVEELPHIQSESEYILSLVRYDLLTRKPHAVTADIARLPRAEQDKIDDEIAAAFAKGESLGGSWFEARLQAAVEAAGTPEPDRPRVMRELLQRLSGKSGGGGGGKKS
jgi:hypothetical protein